MLTFLFSTVVAIVVAVVVTVAVVVVVITFAEDLDYFLLLLFALFVGVVLFSFFG
jgi:hypothetical protein